MDRFSAIVNTLGSERTDDAAHISAEDMWRPCRMMPIEVGRSMLALPALLLISLVSLAGALYARHTASSKGLVAMFVTFTVASQFIATKIATFDFGLFQVEAPAAVMIFAVTFLITDIVNKKFGRKETHAMITLAWLAQALMTMLLLLAGALPGAPAWEGEAAWKQLFGIVPRITLASWVAFLVSENLDAWMFDRFRRWTMGRHLWLRNVFSSIPALTVDTFIFILLAFGNTSLPLLTLIIGQLVVKYIVVLIDMPIMYLNRTVIGPRLAD